MAGEITIMGKAHGVGGHPGQAAGRHGGRGKYRDPARQERAERALSAGLDVG